MVTIAQRIDASPDRRPLRIGSWRVDPANNVLSQGSRITRLEPRAMDLLMALAARPGEVLGREELFALVWPGVVVGDEALSQCVAKLRRALGDDPRSPRYVATIPKRGYRLVAAVGTDPAIERVLPGAHPFAGRVLAAAVLAAGVLLALHESAPPLASALERATVPRHVMRNAEAQALFARAQELFLARGAAENREARALYRRAIEIDPQFARAYAGLAMATVMEHRLDGGTDTGGKLDRALALAETARQIDPDIAEVQWALGFVHTQARHYPEATAALERAIAINPSFADAYALLAGIRTYSGEAARSLPLLRSAMRLDPAGGYLYFLLLGRAYFFTGDFEQAVINLRAAEARNPADLETRLYLAATLEAAGDRDAAAWEVDEIRALQPAFSLDEWLARYPMANAEYRGQLRQVLADLLAARGL